MSEKEILKKIALLETVHDHLTTERSYLNSILILAGFPKGLESVKEVALEMLNSQDE